MKDYRLKFVNFYALRAITFFRFTAIFFCICVTMTPPSPPLRYREGSTELYHKNIIL